MLSVQRPLIASGDRVHLSPGCPLDFEGVGPAPADAGEVIGFQAGSSGPGVAMVRFERRPGLWSIPVAYLDPLA